MEKLDSIGRGTFHHIASQEAVRPTNRELRWLAHVERHGPLASLALIDLTADTHRCRDTGLRALHRLRASGLLLLPPQQRAIERAEFHPYVYDISAAGKDWLKEAGLFEGSVRPTGHWWHSYSVSSLTSAFERAAAKRSVRFVPARKILDIHSTTLGIPYPGGTAVPDQIFALDYGGSFRAFLLEVDRGTEPMTSRSVRESLNQKLTVYARIVALDLHRKHYGLKSPLALLFTFMSQVRARNFIDILGVRHPQLAAMTLAQVLPSDDPMLARVADYVSSPWLRASGGNMDILTH